MPERDDGEYVGCVIRSGIDERVWVAVLPDEDTWTGAMQASTSLRRCKAHVDARARAHDDSPLVWEKVDNDQWDAYRAEEKR